MGSLAVGEPKHPLSKDQTPGKDLSGIKQMYTKTLPPKQTPSKHELLEATVSHLETRVAWKQVKLHVGKRQTRHPQTHLQVSYKHQIILVGEKSGKSSRESLSQKSTRDPKG